MLVFNFIPKARICKSCNTDKHVKLIQLITGNQVQMCTKCNKPL